MHKNLYGKILKEGSKKQYLNTVLKSYPLTNIHILSFLKTYGPDCWLFQIIV